MRIGLIGVGSMGAALVRVLAKSGRHELTIYNRTKSKADALAANNVRVADDPAQCLQGDVCITMVADDQALETLFFDDSTKLLEKQAPNTVHLGMSTVSVALSRRISAASKAAGKRYLVTTVVGRPDVAERGELVLIAAGADNDIETCKPLLDDVGKSLHVVGAKPEQSNVAKLSINFMISSMIATMSEAFALVQKNELDKEVFFQILTAFFQSPIYEKYGKIIVGGVFDTGAFTVKGQEKDTRFALDCAQESQVPMLLGGIIENMFLTAMGRGKGHLDPCVISQIIAENAGVKLT